MKGADVTFGIQAGPGSSLSPEAAASGLSVVTTRPDTLFGVTHMVVAPEHPLLTQLCSEAQSAAVQQYAQAAARKSDLERTELQKDKSGVFTGAWHLEQALPSGHFGSPFKTAFIAGFPSEAVILPSQAVMPSTLILQPLTGSHAINPATGESFPIWVADYVLGGYGSGAIMAVPAHDVRDHEFAAKFGIQIKQV